MIRIAETEPTSIFTFTGTALDNEAGLQLNEIRHYDPIVGRWINDEPIGAGKGDVGRKRGRY